MPFLVDADYVRAQILPTLIGKSGRYFEVIGPDMVQDCVDSAVAEVEQRLSTRVRPTHFIGNLGPDPSPVPDLPTDPAVEPTEYEGPYDWPNMSASAGYLTWRLNVRPIIQVVAGHLVLPGTFTPGIEIKGSWMRVHPTGDIELMPQYGSAALVLPNMPFGLFNWMQQRIPEAMMWEYHAGLRESDWRRYPWINRLIGIRAALKLLPVLSMKINPSGVTSQSADGLSISRKSGYVFADIEDRLAKEADALQSQVLDAWDGTTSLMVL